MSSKAKPQQRDPEARPSGLAEQADTAHEAQVRAAIAEGRAQIKAGKGIPADRVWSDLGIE